MAAALPDHELLARLISFDSTSAKSNLPIADFVCDYLDSPGVEIVRNANADGTKVNVVARIAGKRTGDSATDGLILSGHLDVVPAGESEWRSDPFTLVETTEAFFGRGTCDMKGFIALAMNTARRALKGALDHPLVLILTFDEEVGTCGAQHLVRTWERPFELPHSAIVGEPTSLKVVRMHKGHLTMRVTTAGRSAHSAYPQLGRSAIEPAGRVITALAAVRGQLERIRYPTSKYFPETPFVTLIIGQIAGGTAVNVVPDRCDIDLGARLLPGADSAEIVANIRSALEALTDLGEYSFEVMTESPPLLLGEETAVYRSMCEIVGQSDTCAVSYASDAGDFQQMGIDCVLYGPGSIEVAHKPNEFLPKREFDQARVILDKVVKRMCGG